MRKAIQERIDRAIRERVFPGCIVGIVRGREDPEYIFAGAYTYDANARVVRERSLYDVASITKSIPTASLALALAAEGRLSLREPIRTYIPELHNDHDARVHDLLTYAVSGPRLADLKDLEAGEMLDYIFQRGFDGPPGERVYTNLPALLLGIAIERAMRTNLDILARKYFFGPLKMHDTAFYAGAAFAHAVPTELEGWRGVVSGVAHDESAYALAKAGRVPGHAGLFSTAPDLIAFLSALLTAEGPMWRAIVEGAEAGLGWQLNQPYFMGSHASEKTFGKTGFTGTSVLVDRGRGVALVILSNRTYPHRPPNHDAINALRADIADIVLGALH